MSQLKRTLWHVLMGSTVGLLAISWLAAGDRRAQQANWDNLKELSPGQEIKVVLNDAKSYRGRLENVSDEGIRVSLATGNATFARQDILRVSSKGEPHRGRNAAIAAGIGAGVGAGLGANAGGGSKSGEGLGAFALGGAIVGAFLGAGAGALLPTGGWHDIYRAR